MGKLPWEITEYELLLLNELWQRHSGLPGSYDTLSTLSRHR